MNASNRSEEPDRREIGSILWIGGLSAALYGVVYLAERAIFLNGRTTPDGKLLTGVPADRVRLYWAFLAYGIATVALFALYWRLLTLCRGGGCTARGSRRLALLVPVLLNAGFLFGRPYLSTDAFSYMAHGYLGIIAGHNPYTVPTRDVGTMPFAAQIVPWGWKPETHDVSPYGPLWTQLEVAAHHLSAQTSVDLLFLKSVVVAASLLCAVLIWLILGRVRPHNQLLGTLVYLWNPLIIVEFAAEGHNDAVMIACVLLAILCAVQLRPAGTLTALMLGILAKYVPVLLLPAHVVYLWRIRRSWMHLGVQLTVGLGAGLVLAVLLYQPFWAGAGTFQGVRGQGQARFIASTSMVLSSFLQHSRPEAQAARWASAITTLIFGGYLLIASLRVRDAASLLTACARIALVYVLVASPAYWPWYAALPLALMALVPHDSFFWMSLVLTFCSRLVAPLSDLTVNGFATWNDQVWSTTIAGLVVPLLVFVIVSARQWRRRPKPLAPVPTQ